MTWEIAFLFAVLAVMVYLFMTEKLPVELTAFAGLLLLVFTGYVDVADAFLGFSSPAVITMFSIFFISGALLATGVADVIAARLSHLAGGREVPLIVLVMLVAGVLSAFMNNVAAAAVLMPAISALAKKARIAPSRLFMPLSFGAILGGTTTLVGTPPNILVAEALVERGIQPFNLFDFAPVGLSLLATGILFMTTLGRRLLPRRDEGMEAEASALLASAYRIEERLTSISIPAGSKLDGRSLKEARLGTTLDAQVLAVERDGKKHMAPKPDFRLLGGDVLLVDGHYEDIQELLGVQGVGVQELDPHHLEEVTSVSDRIRGAVLGIVPGAAVVGRTLKGIRFRDRFGVLVVGVRREGDVLRHNLGKKVLRETDQLLVLGSEDQLLTLGEQKAFQVLMSCLPAHELLEERLFVIQVPSTSAFVGESIATSRLGDLVGLTVVGILRGSETNLAIRPDEVLEAGDELVVVGDPTRVIELLDLGELRIVAEPAVAAIESETVGIVEAVVAPRSAAAGATLADLHFRGRYGLQVLALWRSGRLISRELATLRLRFGDALLLHGPRKKISYLQEDPDFLVLGAAVEPPSNTEKAPVALAALCLMITLVLIGYPIHVAAFAGAVVAVLFGALKMEEAYRKIEWKALFLVAAVLPVGGAMESSGAALFLADLVVRVASGAGPYALLLALAVLSSLLSQGLDGAPTVVILAPVVMLTAEQLGLSPYPLMMVVGLAASAAFMTPFSHKANLLVMSAGGYRAMDYVRVGTPLTVVVLGLLVVLAPVFFPL